MPACPPEMEYIWGWFCELSCERPKSLDGLEYLTSTGLLNWCDLQGVRLTQFELQAIRRLDNIYLVPLKIEQEDPDD